MKALLICGIFGLHVLGDGDIAANPLNLGANPLNLGANPLNLAANPLNLANSLSGNSLSGNPLQNGLSSGAVLDTLVNAFVTDGYLNPAGQTAVRMSGLATEAYRDPELNDVLTGRTPALDSAGNLSNNVRQALHNRGIEATRPEDLMPYALNRVFSTTNLQPRKGFTGLSEDGRMRRDDLGGRMMDSPKMMMGPKSMDKWRPNDFDRMMTTMRQPMDYNRMDYNRMRSNRPPGGAPYRFQEAASSPYPAMYGANLGVPPQYAPYQTPPMNYFAPPYFMNPMYGFRMDMDPFRSMYGAPTADRPFTDNNNNNADTPRTARMEQPDTPNPEPATPSLLNAIPPRLFGDAEPRMAMGPDQRMDTRLAPDYAHHHFAAAASPTIITAMPPLVDANAILLALGQSDIDITKLLQSVRNTGIDLNAIHQSLHSRHIDWNTVFDGLAATNIDINATLDKLQDVNINNVLTALGSSNLNLSHLLLSMLQGTKPQDLDTSSVLATGNDFSTIFSDPDVAKMLDIVTTLPTLPPTN